MTNFVTDMQIRCENFNVGAAVPGNITTLVIFVVSAVVVVVVGVWNSGCGAPGEGTRYSCTKLFFL